MKVNIGKAAATRFLANDFQVLISTSKGPETLTGIVSQLGTGAKAVTAAEAVAADIDGGLASSEVVQNYLPGAKVVKAMNTLFAKVLIDITRPGSDIFPR